MPPKGKKGKGKDFSKGKKSKDKDFSKGKKGTDNAFRAADAVVQRRPR